MPDQGYNVTLSAGADAAPVTLEASGGSGSVSLAGDAGDGGVSAENAEAWAVGKRGGVAVDSGDDTYENNAKWYAQEMARILNNVRVINYVVCETAGNVRDKVVTVDNYVLEVGAWVCVRFMNNNTVLSCKLNVSNTGARWIKYNNRTLGKGDINTRQTYLFIFDGTDYQLVGMTEIGRASGKLIGYKSVAFGDDVEASGSFTASFGNQTRARDDGTMAVGVLNHDRRGDVWNKTSTYASGAIVCLDGEYEVSDGEYEDIDGTQYFEAKSAVPAGACPLVNGSLNSTYWKRIPGLVFTVGNGNPYEEGFDDDSTPDWNRRNAFGVDTSGNGYFDGDVYVNSDAKSTSGTKLISEAALNALRGANSGLAALDESGKVPAAQLPSFVDDVLEYASLSAFPATGESGKIYVAQDTGKVYRWASTQYTIISDYVHPSYTARTGKPTGNQTPGFGGTFTVSQVESDTTGHVSGMTDRTVTIPNSVATTSTAGLMSAEDKAYLEGLVDDTAGDGDEDLTWSADKLMDECFRLDTGAITSLPKIISDARITEECWIEDFTPDANVDLGWVTQDGKLILYGSLPTGTTLASQKLTIHRVHGMTNDAVTISLRQQNSTNENGNYLVAEARNLTPGTQYSYRLYSLSGATATQVYAVGTVVRNPSHNMWFQQVPRGLTDDTDYYCTIAVSSAPSVVLATSNTVTFEAAEMGGG